MAIDANVIGRLLRRAVKAFGGVPRSSASTPPTPSRRSGPAVQAPDLSSTYPGDYRGSARITYAPKPDGEPDPGEVVWTWVPYEEDHSQGKDRPVLLVGRNGGRLLALMMTTRDRNNGHDTNPDYIDVGTGPWDRMRRPSEVKLDRILQVDPRDIRREGAVLGKAAFERVAGEMRRRHGWK